MPQILEALPLAVQGGLRLPLLYNTSAYESPDSLRLMDAVVDVYMLDLKLSSSELERRYLGKREYFEVASGSVREMHRRVGDLVLDERGLARRGLIVRQLLMPGMIDETEAVLRFVAKRARAGTDGNLMGQYQPAGRSERYAEINRRPYPRSASVPLTSPPVSGCAGSTRAAGARRSWSRRSPRKARNPIVWPFRR